MLETPELVIPGYEAVIPNLVFEKGPTSILDDAGRKHETARVLMLEQFRVPTPDEICEFIAESAERVDEGNDSGSDTDELLSNLPKEKLALILSRERGLRRLVRSTAGNFGLDPERRYARIHAGDIPLEAMDVLNSPEYVDNKAALYEKLLSQDGLGCILMSIRTNEDESFLSIEQIEQLVADRVHDSAAIKIYRSPSRSYTLANSYMRTVSRALRGHGIGILDDNSSWLLDSRASGVLDIIFGVNKEDKKKANPPSIGSIRLSQTRQMPGQSYGAVNFWPPEPSPGGKIIGRVYDDYGPALIIDSREADS